MGRFSYTMEKVTPPAIIADLEGILGRFISTMEKFTVGAFLLAGAMKNQTHRKINKMPI